MFDRPAAAAGRAAADAGASAEEARRLIAQQGFDPVYGARPLRRFIAREVETRIGRALLAGDVKDGAIIRVDAAEGEITVSYENPG